MTNSNLPNDQLHAPLEETAKTIAEPFRAFVTAQSAAGWLLLSATILAIGFANSPWGSLYYELLHIELGLTLAGKTLEMSLQHWVNDGLMAVFFFLLGLELKRELCAGQLSELKKATSVLCAAIGGMTIPALVFLSVGEGADIRSGWAIPVATDTAFALMVLVLLGNRVPPAARVFLVGLAIVDDMGAILVIAFAYTDDFNVSYWFPVAIAISTLMLLNLLGVRSGWAYLSVGAVLWWLLTHLGLHGTLTGVIVASAAPVRPTLSRPSFVSLIKRNAYRFEKEHDRESIGILEQPKQQQIAREVMQASVDATTPLNRWEDRLERPISFAVMPLFAFMNAGVVFSARAIQDAWASDLSVAILLGLLVGKPAGILLGVWLGTVIGWASLPKDLSWRHVFGLGMLGAIGFTMSLFIATLSFGENSHLLEIAKQSVLITSLCAGVIGYAWLRWACHPVVNG